MICECADTKTSNDQITLLKRQPVNYGIQLSKPLFNGSHYANPLSFTTWTGIPNVIKFGLYKLELGLQKRWIIPKDVTKDLPLRIPHFYEDSKFFITWLGHSTMVVHMNELNIIIDPVWSKFAAPIPYLTQERIINPPCKVEDLPKIDFGLISHNHYDHLDLIAIRNISMLSPTMVWFVPMGLKSLLDNILADIGVKVTEMTWHIMCAQHISPVEAVEIHKLVSAKKSLGVHWGTYDMDSAEHFLKPKEDLKQACIESNLLENEFFTLAHGETLCYPFDINKNSCDENISFKLHVNEVMSSEMSGYEVGRICGINPQTRKCFALVITKVAWYAVRLINEGDDHSSSRKEFLTFDNAMLYAQNIKRNIETVGAACEASCALQLSGKSSFLE